MSGPVAAFWAWLILMIIIGVRESSETELRWLVLAVSIVFGSLIAILWWGGFFS